MRRLLPIVAGLALLVAGVWTLAAAPAASAAKPEAAVPAARRPATGLAATIERTAASLLPQAKFDRALGFFAPVTRKYLPVFGKFQAEYDASSDKVGVIVRYLPQAEAAVAEARAMKVPDRFRAEKDDYLKMADGFLSAARLATSLVR